MKLLRVAAWTVWFMLGWIPLAHAGPIVAAITALSTFLASGTIAATLVKFAIGIALQIGASLIQKALAKKQRPPGIKGEISVGGNNSLSFMTGSYATAGQLEYVNTWGTSGKTPNAFLTQVISLSDMPVAGLQSARIWINSEACTIGDVADTWGDLGYPVEEFKKGGLDHLWVKFYDGSQTVADPYLLAKLGSDPDRPWLADMIGRGVPYAILTARINRELFTSIPAARWEIAGIPLYDPRLDTTVGGSGPQRWGQPATYAFSDNPAVIIYNILRGIYYEGEWVYGPAVPATRLPLSNWFAAMNECDVAIALDGGGTERQFRAGYEIRTAEDEPADIIEELLSACNGRIAEIGGTYKIHVGAPGLPVYFFSDEDIVVTEGQSFDPFPGYEATFNGAAASYPEPEAAWAMKDAPQYSDPDFLAADNGEPRVAPLTFNAAPFPLQVQRLMRSMTNDNRRFRRHQHTLPPEAWLFEPLDTFSWSSARNGYEAKQFLVNEMDDLDNANQAVALLETDPSDYDWSPGFELPWSVGPLDPRTPPAQTLTGWQVQPATIYDAAGKARRPAIEVFFDGDLDDIRAVRILVRLQSSGEIIFDGELPYGEPDQVTKSVILNGTFLPATIYEAQGQFVPFSGRPTTPSAWLPVLTPDILLGPDDLYPIDLDGLADDIRDWQDWISGDVREVIDEARRLAAKILDQSYSDYDDRQQIRQEIVSEREGVKAGYFNAISIATGPTSAISQRIEILEVEIAGKASATAVDLLTTRVDTIDGEVTANADAILLLSAEVGDVASSVTMRGQAMASPGGGWARWGVEVKTGSGDNWSSAALFLDTNGALSRAVFVADQFIITNGTDDSQPFVFTEGIAYLTNARIGDLVFDKLRSADGKMVISGMNGTYIDVFA